MSEPNTAKFNKLVTLLRELFQLDQPDLDFGIYRIMHAKASEVTQFLQCDLLPQVREAFAHYQSADSSELKKKLEQMPCSPFARRLRAFIEHTESEPLAPPIE